LRRTLESKGQVGGTAPGAVSEALQAARTALQ